MTRTTLTLDDDVAAALRRLQREAGGSWKRIVNDALRAGVDALETADRRAPSVRRTRAVRLGPPRVGDLSNVHEVLSLVEGDARR